MSLHVVILAAGQGKRMYSKTPKVLHTIGGVPMLSRVIDVARQLSPEQIHIIYGHEGQQLKDHIGDQGLNWVEQSQQLGTGHAVLQAMPHIPHSAEVLVLSADVPLIRLETLQRLVKLAAVSSHSLALLVAKLKNPTGLGRIIRDNRGSITAIVEEKDATDEQKQIREIYSGICCAPAKHLARWLPALDNDNAQQEYYLTKIIDFAMQDNLSIASLAIEDDVEIRGVNNRLQLQELERIWQHRQAQQLLLNGVMIADAKRIDVRGTLECAQDVFIDVNTVFIGKVIVGDNCTIGPNCVLNNVVLGDNCRIFANSVLDDCKLENNCSVGPFARLRTGTHLKADCKIGNFVETKKAVFGQGSKASHLSYLGDVDIGEHVNIGAGTITCNYDGVNKHKTIIEDGVFIGSDTQLVAPVTIGKNATIGAGSTIRKDVPAEELTLTESRQKTIAGWKRPEKKG